MRSKSSLINWAAIAFIFLGALLLALQLIRYSSARALMPSGLKIAGIRVGGLTAEQATDRLNQVYLAPIELIIGEARVQVRPATLGYRLKTENMLAAADQQRTSLSFWVGFWRYLWNVPVSSEDIPLQYELDQKRLTSYLQNEIEPRYGHKAQVALPIPGDIGFNTQAGGIVLDYETSLSRIETCLSSSTDRLATLATSEIAALKPGMNALDYSLKSLVDESSFDGIVEVYLKDLQTGDAIHFTRQKNQSEETPVDIAFSAWSTIKIPILVSSFAHSTPPYPQQLIDDMAKMIALSDNSATDIVAQTGIDKIRGPLIMTEDVRALGLQNTFWGGYFELGSPLLEAFKSPASQRTDIDTKPDPYAQTTPADLGMLLEDIYYCAQNYGGAFPLVFSDEITQNECKTMVDMLANDKIGQMIQAGVPAGTVVAHKHGWAVESRDGYMHTIGDAGIVYTPGGNYVLSVFAHHPVQAIFDSVNILVSQISSAAYNFYNLSALAAN